MAQEKAQVIPAQSRLLGKRGGFLVFKAEQGGRSNPRIEGQMTIIAQVLSTTVARSRFYEKRISAAEIMRRELREHAM